ncbi:MAG: cell division protein FtsZ [Syntrophobacterales bacterium]|jgi:cell division protein FtsZ
MKIQLVPTESTAKIKVLGIGGAGGNAINDMIKAEMAGVDFVAANSDAMSLDRNLAPIKIQLGPTVTRGLGAGGNPEIGREATREEADRIRQVLDGADMVFIAAGMGGGTGTGGAPVVAEISREVGALTVAVVSKPFEFEGKMKMRLADKGIEELRRVSDTIITIPNDRLFSLGNKNSRTTDIFSMANEVLGSAVRGISDLIVKPAFIKVDFADVRTIMKEGGMALMGTGLASGNTRAVESAERAISHPLLEDISIKGARGILINITTSEEFSLEELREVCTIIQREAHDEALIKWGLVYDGEVGESMQVTVIATGIGHRLDLDKGRDVWHAPPPELPITEDLEIPAFIRKGGETAQTPEGGSGEKRPALGVVQGKKYVVHPDLQYEESELDTPPFLRKVD